MKSILPIDTGANWYVIYTKSRHEKKIESLLDQRNITSFLPQRDEIKQWSDRKRKVLVPLFPNYIFVKSNPKDFWIIKSIQGVIGFVGHKNEGGPVSVSEKIIHSIKQVMKGNITISNTQFNKGDWVQVVSGPFMGVEGVFIRQCNKSVLAIEITLIQRSICVEINPMHLQQIKHNPVVENSGQRYRTSAGN